MPSVFSYEMAKRLEFRDMETCRRLRPASGGFPTTWAFTAGIRAGQISPGAMDTCRGSTI